MAIGSCLSSLASLVTGTWIELENILSEAIWIPLAYKQRLRSCCLFICSSWWHLEVWRLYTTSSSLGGLLKRQSSAAVIHPPCRAFILHWAALLTCSPLWVVTEGCHFWSFSQLWSHSGQSPVCAIDGIGCGSKHDTQLSAHGSVCPSLSSPWSSLPSSPPFFVGRNLHIWILQGEWLALSFKGMFYLEI